MTRKSTGNSAERQEVGGQWSRGCGFKIGHMRKGGESRMGVPMWFTEACDLAPFRHC